MSSGGGIARLLRDLKNEDWVSALINRHYSRATPERWVHADPTIHPSTLGSPCPLEIELSLLGHRTPADGQGRRRMDNGTDIGKRWARAFKDMGVLVVAEAAARSDDPLISGSADVIVQRREDGRKSVGEIKSINSYGFNALPTPTPNRAQNMRGLMVRHRNYCLQLTAYMTLLKLDGWFLFENKDNQEFKVFWVEPLEELRAEVFGPTAPARRAQEAFYEGNLIAPPYKRTSKTCASCYRKSVCFKLQDGDVDLWKRVQEQFTHAGVEPKIDMEGWPAAGPQKLDEEVL